jgi:hypothetical protein
VETLQGEAREKEVTVARLQEQIRERARLQEEITIAELQEEVKEEPSLQSEVRMKEANHYHGEG